MSIVKKEIFIASRFEEFNNIRTILSEKINAYNFMEAIDLNDNQASHRSPLEESLFHARKSEVMILLVGETYGTIPDGESKSYTHLEYEEANQESSNTRILVFCIGKSYNDKYINYSSNQHMKDWQVELEKNHRLSKFNESTDENEIIDNIMVMLLTSIYELNPKEDLDLPQDTELYLDTLDEEENFLEDEDVTFLDNQKFEVDGIELIETTENNIEGFELLKIPGKLAALEQKQEAKNAIELKDYYTATIHLRKALEIRPLDFESNYWLAKLYVASAKKNLFYEIEEYLIRAAKIAQQENSIYKASHCYQLIIQASIFSDKEREGLKYIKFAEDLTPNYARVYYEKAKFMFYFKNYDEAKTSLIQAINIRIDILKEVAHDPFFMQYKTIINDVKENFKDRLFKSCYAISSNLNEIKKSFNKQAEKIDLNNLSIYELWKKSRQMFLEQYYLIATNMKYVDENKILLLEKKIDMLDEQCNKDMSKLTEEFTNNLKELKNENTTMINSINSKYANLSDYNMYITICMIIAVVGFSVILYYDSIKNSKLFIPTSFLVISIIIEFVKNKLNKQYQHDLNDASTKFEFNKDTLKKKQEEEEKELYEKLLLDKESCNKEINDIHNLYKNIKTAFNTFESTTVHKTTSKLVPFKSLNNSLYDSIIRVTPQAYKKHLENGYKIEIENDFPFYLNIDSINDVNTSFLARVIKKDKNNIILSRYQAYVKHPDVKEEHIKQNNGYINNNYLNTQ